MVSGTEPAAVPQIANSAFAAHELRLAHDPAAVVAFIEQALGIDMPDARNLGGIVSWFAQDPDSWPGEKPGVGDIVELSDHAACGRVPGATLSAR